MTAENTGFYQDYVFILVHNNADLLLYWKAYNVIGRFAKVNRFPILFLCVFEILFLKNTLVIIETSKV